MTVETECHCLNQCRTPTGSRAVNGLLRSRVHRRRIVAVDVDTRHRISRGALGNLIYRGPVFVPGMLGVTVVLTDENDRQLPDGREIKGLVEGSDIGRSVAKIGYGNSAVSPYLRGQ